MNEDTTPIGTTTSAGGGRSPASAEPGFGGSATDRVAQQGKETGQSFRDQGQHLKETAREKGAEAASNLKEGARSAARDAMGYGRTVVEDQKSNLADKVQEYADAARAASERLKGDQDLLAGPAERAAAQLDRASRYLRDKQPGDFLDDLESFARQRPEIVYGGMFVAGLAAARFFKASRRSSREISRSSYAESPTSTSIPAGGLTATESTSPSWQSAPSKGSRKRAGGGSGFEFAGRRLEC